MHTCKRAQYACARKTDASPANGLARLKCNRHIAAGGVCNNDYTCAEPTAAAHVLRNIFRSTCVVEWSVEAKRKPCRPAPMWCCQNTARVCEDNVEQRPHGYPAVLSSLPYAHTHRTLWHTGQHTEVVRRSAQPFPRTAQVLARQLIYTRYACDGQTTVSGFGFAATCITPHDGLRRRFTRCADRPCVSGLRRPLVGQYNGTIQACAAKRYPRATALRSVASAARKIKCLCHVGRARH